MPHRLTSRDFRAIRASMSRDIAAQRQKGCFDGADSLEEIVDRVIQVIDSLDAPTKGHGA